MFGHEPVLSGRPVCRWQSYTSEVNVEYKKRSIIQS
jgi:hypothetical protein